MSNEGKTNFSNNFNIRDFLHVDRMTNSEIDKCEFWVNANRIVRESGVPNCEGARIQVNDKWDLETFKKWLIDYHDKNVVRFLRYGWPLNAYNTKEDCTVPPNQAGARAHPEELKQYIKKEREMGSVIGPFKNNPFGKVARFSPLDTRPKRDSDELRVILNLSYPFGGESVNSSINSEVFAGEDNMELRYASVDDLCKIIRKKGPKAKIFVRDLSKAYRQLFMDPGSIHLLGYWIEDELFFDVSLSMGSKAAAYCCQRMTSAITHVFGSHGFENVNYLDDLGAAEEENKAEEAYDCLGWIMDTIGIKESRKKAKPPAFIAVFLGILYNTKTMTLTITNERLVELKSLLNEWTHKKHATLREVQSLLGKLNFACNTVRSGRIFVSRIINSLRKYPIRGFKKVDRQMRKDIEWWIEFTEHFDGITIMPPGRWNAPDTVLSSDAALQGGGGWSEQRCEAFHTKFPSWLTDRKDVFINELELITIIVALKVWSRDVEHKNILAYCDNEVSVEVVNSGRAKNNFTQACLREICYIMATNNAMLKLVHISGISNRISDCLSRWDEESKRMQFRTVTEGKNVKFVEVNEEMFKFLHDW